MFVHSVNLVIDFLITIALCALNHALTVLLTIFVLNVSHLMDINFLVLLASFVTYRIVLNVHQTIHVVNAKVAGHLQNAILVTQKMGLNLTARSTIA